MATKEQVLGDLERAHERATIAGTSKITVDIEHLGMIIAAVKSSVVREMVVTHIAPGTLTTQSQLDIPANLDPEAFSNAVNMLHHFEEEGEPESATELAIELFRLFEAGRRA